MSATVVGVVMGSDSDWPVMEAAAEALDEFGVALRGRTSSRRTGCRTRCSSTAPRRADRGLRVIIAGAGGAAHLPGMLAAVTPLPVIGVPVPLAHLDGWTRCCRSCRCPPACRSPRCRSAARATPACSPCGSWPRPTRDLLASDARTSRTSCAHQAEAKGAALRARRGTATGFSA